MSRFLLDTNIISHLIRQPRGPVRERMNDAVRDGVVYTAVIVAAELRFGARRRQAFRFGQQLDRVLHEIVIAPFAEPMDQRYADIRAELERRGTPIGANDLWIAAQALHDGSVLVTDNTREFGRVPDLRIENWLGP